MKKWKVLIPSLVATASIPLVSVVGCGKGRHDPEVEPPTFTVSSGSMLTEKIGTILLNWEPIEHNISFDANSFIFTYGDSKQAISIVPLNQSNPLELKLSFNDAIKQDISDGQLTFHYDDETVGIASDETISNINIHAYTQPTRDNFSTCKWTVVKKACDVLEKTNDVNEFCKYFSLNNINKDPTSLSDFVGQKRTVKINGYLHYVIVVGCQEDFLPKEDSTPDINKPVALTFQFQNLISNENWDAVKTCWNEKNNNSNYWTSVMYRFLNDEKDTEITSVYEMIANDDNDNLANFIQDVSRAVLVKKNNKWSPTTQTTKIFCPTISNLFSNVGIDNTTLEWFVPDKDLYKAEGHIHDINESVQYSYYAIKDDNHIGDEPIWNSQWKIFMCLNLATLKGENSWYWISTPRIDNNNGAWNIYPDNSGSRLRYQSTTEELAVAPCFSI